MPKEKSSSVDLLATADSCQNGLYITIMMTTLWLRSTLLFMAVVIHNVEPAKVVGFLSLQHTTNGLFCDTKSSVRRRPLTTKTNLINKGIDDNNNDDHEEQRVVVARRIMYNQHCRKRKSMSYQVIAAEAWEPLARRMEWAYPDRFTFHPTIWNKFPDGTDEIEIGGFTPNNLISGEHVLFLASFHNNDVTLSQFQVMICLLQSFVESLTVALPYSPVGRCAMT